MRCARPRGADPGQPIARERAQRGRARDHPAGTHAGLYRPGLHRPHGRRPRRPAQRRRSAAVAADRRLPRRRAPPFADRSPGGRGEGLSQCCGRFRRGAGAGQPQHRFDWALRGYKGRALRSGDEIGLRGARWPPRAILGRRLANEPPSYAGEVATRVVLGPQVDRFTEEGIATFLEVPSVFR